MIRHKKSYVIAVLVMSAALASVLCFTSCNKIEEIEPNNEGQIELSQYRLDVPPEGGQYVIKVKSDDVVQPEPNNYGGYPVHPLQVVTSSVYATPVEHISVEGKNIKISVEQSYSRIMADKTVRLYAIGSERYADIVIHQEGKNGGIRYSSFGKAVIGSMYDQFWLAHSRYYTFDENYARRYPEWAQRPYLRPNDNDVYYLFEQLKAVREKSGEMSRTYMAPSDSMMQAVTNMCHGWSLGLSAALWKDIPVTDGSETHMRSYTDMMAEAAECLENAYKILPEGTAMEMNSYDDIPRETRDIARWLLAEVMMEQGDYDKAHSRLLEICQRGDYTLTAQKDYRTQDPEILWGIDREAKETSFDKNFRRWISKNNDGTFNYGGVNGHVWLTYTDVLLALTECELHLGQDVEAERLAHTIAQAKDVELSDSSNPLAHLNELYKALSSMSGCGRYFLFLRRNGLAETELGLEHYQLLLPIPQTYCQQDGVVQNPGY